MIQYICEYFRPWLGASVKECVAVCLSVRACLLIFLVAPVLCDISRREALVVFTHVTEGHQDPGRRDEAESLSRIVLFFLLELRVQVSL